MLAIAVAGTCAVEAEQADIDSVGPILVIKAECALFLVNMLRRTRWRQRRKGGSEMRTGHVGMGRGAGAFLLLG